MGIDENNCKALFSFHAVIVWDGIVKVACVFNQEDRETLREGHLSFASRVSIANPPCYCNTLGKHTQSHDFGGAIIVKIPGKVHKQKRSQQKQTSYRPMAQVWKASYFSICACCGEVLLLRSYWGGVDGEEATLTKTSTPFECWGLRSRKRDLGIATVKLIHLTVALQSLPIVATASVTWK